MEWALGDLVDDALLIASELITNSVTETGKVEWARRPPVGLRLHGGPSSLVVQVWDAVLRAPLPRAATADDESGRGLAIVAGLSTSCGFYFPGKLGGKVTWAMLGTSSALAGRAERPGLRMRFLAPRLCRQESAQALGSR